MINNKNLIYIAISLAIAGALIFYATFFQDAKEPVVDEEVYLHIDKGLIMEHEDRETSVFERYRFYDDRIPGPDKAVNISEENAQLVVTHPDGTKEDVTSGLWFYPLSIIPPSPEGQYKITATLHSGEVYEEEFYFTEPKEGSLIPVEDATKQGDDGEELKAFSLGGVDLTNASSVFHIPPSGAVIDIVPQTDKYMWLSLDMIEEERLGEHIFLAKVDGAWYYTRVNTPDFEF